MNCLDEPIFIAVSKPLLTEFGIHHGLESCVASQCSIFSFFQMEELELRKEIEAKRKREGKWVEPKLTPKQKEALAGTFFYKGFLRENAIYY